jgi:hypothetical protein
VVDPNRNPNHIDIRLCFQRIQKRFVTTEIYDPTNTDKLWLPFSATSPFVVSPADASKDDYQYYLTYQHHSKNEEVVALKDCSQGYRYDTGDWVSYPVA